MYEPIYLKHTDDRKVHFLSDPHYGHDKSFIYEPRGHDNVQDHDADFELKWNDKIGPNDTVILLGDTILGQNGEARLLMLFKNLNFRDLYISPGNHFGGWKQVYQHAKTKIFNLPPAVTVYPLRVVLRKMYGESFPEDKTVTFMPNLYEVYVNGQFIVCSHYPIASWNGIGKGAWNICGHTHGRFHGSKKDTLNEGKILDVGIENVGGPIDFVEVETIMRSKTTKIVDHHGADTKYSI